jgi:hypothetical protein
LPLNYLVIGIVGRSAVANAALLSAWIGMPVEPFDAETGRIRCFVSPMRVIFLEATVGFIVCRRVTV